MDFRCLVVAPKLGRLNIKSLQFPFTELIAKTAPPSHRVSCLAIEPVQKEKLLYLPRTYKSGTTLRIRKCMTLAIGTHQVLVIAKGSLMCFLTVRRLDSVVAAYLLGAYSSTGDWLAAMLIVLL